MNAAGYIEFTLNKKLDTLDFLTDVDDFECILNDNLVLNDISGLSHNDLLNHAYHIRKQIESYVGGKIKAYVKYKEYDMDECENTFCHPDAKECIDMVSTYHTKITLTNNMHFYSNVLYCLSKKESGAIHYIDISDTNIGYNGIIAVWKSNYIGSLISDIPTYERHTGTPVSVIKIEIAGSRAYTQYQKQLFKYPLPLLKDFTITYGHLCVGNSYDLIGYKQVILLYMGKELNSNGSMYSAI